MSRPWEVVDGKERTTLQRHYVHLKVWKVALRAAKVRGTRDNGRHALRHFFASMMLDGGETIRALADQLGHADPGFTLRVYTHPHADDGGLD